MRIPLYKHLQSDALVPLAGISHSFAQAMHPNPRFYKYRWWVFWKGSPCEGRQFLDRKYSLCTADFVTLTDRLRAEGEQHFIYNKQYPRHEAGETPFCPQHPRWEGVEFQVPLSEDADPEYMLHR